MQQELSEEAFIKFSSGMLKIVTNPKKNVPVNEPLLKTATHSLLLDPHRLFLPYASAKLSTFLSVTPFP